MLQNKVSSLLFGILITILSTNIYASDSHDEEHKVLERKLIQFVKKFSGITTIAPVEGFLASEGEKFDGISEVIRLKGQAKYSVNAVGLKANEAHTVWYGVFNKPEACAIPCECNGADIPNQEVGFGMFWAGGRVADEYGQINIDGLVNYGRYNNDQILLGKPMQSRRAEIQIVLRTHGVASADPGILEKQLTEYQGGCDVAACEDYVLTVHKSPFCETK